MDDLRWMDLAEEAGQLREAMVHRAAIEQAKGVVATLRRCSTDEAFAALRQVSMDRNVKIRDLCAAVVAAVADVAPSDGTDGVPGDSAEPAVAAAVAAGFGRDLARLRLIEAGRAVDVPPEVPPPGAGCTIEG